MRIDTLPNDARGVDTNDAISETGAHTLKDHGYSFAIRYVRRRKAGANDITMSELDRIVAAGLGIMLVQHFSGEGWTPSGALGLEYGANAVDHAKVVGYLPGASLWMDLESVATGTPAGDTIAHCNAWYDQVHAAGFRPGLYVGYGCGLTPEQLFANLRFAQFWAAYNLNRDQYPSIRGVMMRQHAAQPTDLCAGFTNQNLDVDTIHTDAKGDTPTLVFA